MTREMMPPRVNLETVEVGEVLHSLFYNCPCTYTVKKVKKRKIIVEVDKFRTELELPRSGVHDSFRLKSDLYKFMKCIELARIEMMEHDIKVRHRIIRELEVEIARILKQESPPPE